MAASSPDRLEDSQAASRTSLGLLRHLPEQRVLLCRSCEFCIVPSQVPQHLQRHHSALPLSRRAAIAQSAAQLPGLAQTVAEVGFPLEHEPPVPHLAVKAHCFQCRQCSWLAESLSGIKGHCRREHQWQSSRSRGGSLQRRRGPHPDGLWTTGHFCQQWFKAPGWKRLTKVQPPPDPGIQTSSRPRVQQFGEEILQGLERARQQRKDERVVTLLHARSEVNPWMQHTAWDTHLYGFNRARLKESLYPLDLPAEELSDTERGLAKACTATVAVLRFAIRLCHPSRVPRSALLFVNRREAGASSSKKPFYSTQRPDTLQKYYAVWVKILRYLWRSQQWAERPPYRLTAEQADALKTVQLRAGQTTDGLTRQQAHQQEDDFHRAIGDFWKAMLAHHLTDNEFQSGLISGIAVLGLDTTSGEWAQPGLFTPRLSAIVTLSRALVIYLAWRQRELDVRRGLGAGLALADAKEQAASIFPAVQQMVQDWMCLTEFNGKPSPISYILHMRNFGLKICLTTKSVARVAWRNGFDEVAIDQVSFTMAELRTVVHGLHDTCRDRLVTQLMWLPDEEQLPPLQLGRLFDNPAELVEGWSWLDDARNTEELQHTPRERFLWRKMINDDGVARQMLQGDVDRIQCRQDLRFNESGVEDYFRVVKQFKEELIVLCHLTAGAPARGPELFSVMHCNGMDSRAQRGVFIDDGLVEMVISYHKGFSISQKVKIIHRYLPEEVGELLVYFLWLVEPFVRQLQHLTRQQTEFGSHLWEPAPERIDPWEADVDEGDDSSIHEDLDPAVSGIGDDAVPSSTGDPSRSPTPYTGRPGSPRPRPRLPLNVDGFWSTDRLKRVMRRECCSRIGVGFSPSQWRQVYPAIQRVHMQSAEATELLDQLYSATPAPSQQSQQTQSAHSQYTEDMVYGISSVENPLATFTQQRQFKKLSQMWHQFLQFPSATASSDQPSWQQQEEKSQAVTAARWHRLGQVDLRAQLQQTIHPRAEFRGIQQPALQAIASRQPRVVLVMKTGGGKSLMYMLPALCAPGGLTIVVVPLSSLQADQARRCKQAGLRVACWGDTRAVRLAQVVLVTPESATTKAFGRFLQEKGSAGLLDRVVIDECHTVLDSGHGWRPKLLQLSRMVEQRCQLLYLTATLPPAEEETFLACSGLTRPDTLLMRESTSRSNVAYSVVEYAVAEQDEVVQRVVRAQLQQMTTPGQVILYCKSIQQCQHMGQLLGCPTFFRTVGSVDEKQALLSQFIQQQVRVIAATNALGLGIDAPSVRAVIHLGVPSRMRDYAQESGRAGRDGKRSEAIVLRSFDWVGGRKKVERGWNMDASVVQFLQGLQCRRISLDYTLDGRSDRTSCQTGEERCDVCRKEWCREKETAVERPRPAGRGHKRRRSSTGSAEVQAVQRAQQVHRQRERQLEEIRAARRVAITTEIIDPDQLQKKLRDWSQIGCVVCWARGEGRRGPQGGSWHHCPSHPLEASQRMTASLEQVEKVRYQRFSGCLYCGLPQAICHLWEEKHRSQGTQTAAFQKRAGGQCQYPGLVKQVAAAIISQQMGETEGMEDHRSQGSWQWVKKEMQGSGGLRVGQGGRVDEWARFWEWVGVKYVSNGLECSRMVQMIYHVG